MARKSVSRSRTKDGQRSIVRWYAPADPATGKGHQHLARTFTSDEDADRFERRLESVLKDDPITAEDAFQELLEAVGAGRVIVPLLGARLSVASAVSSGPRLRGYLLRLKTKIDGQDAGPYHEWLDRNGWPDPRELHAEVELPAVPGTDAADWREVFYNLTLGSGADAVAAAKLVARFRDEVLHGLQSSTSHAFVAFLTRLLNWRLLLTTSLDDLLEQVLKEQEVTAHRLAVPDSGLLAVPDALDEAVRDGVKVVKLYDTTPDQLLHEPRRLHGSGLEVFKKYLPKSALLVVLGEDGDRRVLQLVAELADDPSARRDLKVLWVSRHRPPAEVLRAATGTVGYVLYDDEELFLHEFYGHLRAFHELRDPYPVSALPYRAIPQVPPRVEPPDEAVAREIRARNQPAVVFQGVSDPASQSARLARYHKTLCASYDIIRADAEEADSLDTFVQMILTQFRRFDPALPPTVLSDIAYDETSPDRRDPRLARLLQAMGRGNYLIALDALEEFGTSHIEPDEGDSPPELRAVRRDLFAECATEREKVFEFLCELLRHAKEFGTSRLAIAYAPRAPAGPREQEFVALANDLPAADFEEPAVTANRRPPDDADRAALPDDARGLLLLASAFRRPRSQSLLAYLGKNTDVRRAIGTLLARPSAGGMGSVGADAGWEVEKLLAGLGEKGLLIRQDGGFYRMPRAVRDRVYREAVGRARTNPEVQAALANLHDLIAIAYHEKVFLPSDDATAFIESVFHRLGSLHHPDQVRAGGRLRLLISHLAQEHGRLLAQGHAGLLVRWLKRLRTYDFVMIYPPPLDDNARDVRRALCDLEADVRRHAADFRGCIRIRLQQIGHRLDKDGHGGTTGPRARAVETRVEQLDRCEYSALSKSLMHVLTDRDRGSLPAPVWRRLLDHIFQIAVCLSGLRQFGEASELLSQILKDVGAADKPEKARGAGKQPAKHSRDRDLMNMQVRCHYRLMTLHLEQIRLWDYPREEVEWHLGEAERAYEAAQALLEEYLQSDPPARPMGGADNSFYQRYRCYIEALQCRVAYLRAHSRVLLARPGDEPTPAAWGREFTQALEFIRQASAKATRLEGQRATELAPAVCKLMETELLMLYADCESRLPDGGAETSPRDKLKRAQDALARAGHALLRSHRNVWWYTWYYALGAQLRHELFAWSFHRRAGQEDKNARESYLAAGLAAISSGLDNIAKDQARRQYLETLWGQLYIGLFLHNALAGDAPFSPDRSPARRARFGEEVMSKWKELNDHAGLSWYLECAGATVERLTHSLCQDKLVAQSDDLRQTLLRLEKKYLGRARPLEIAPRNSR
ncbi:MAG TPA: hypothetical protein VD866_14375 [Urbifossiella sp.]|nr:hypothetical protein [Urbifossiella sp.]